MQLLITVVVIWKNYEKLSNNFPEIKGTGFKTNFIPQILTLKIKENTKYVMPERVVKKR